MKNFYITVGVKGNKNENIFSDEKKEYEEGYFACVIKVSESDNLKNHLEAIRGLVHANIRPTKKDAQELADFWNECYKQNGTYLYSK